MLEILNTTKKHVCGRKARRLSDDILSFYKLSDKDVSLVVIGDRKMRTLNRDFRGIDKSTDVLSFPTAKTPARSKAPEQNLLGEIFINLDDAARPEKYLELFGRRRSREYIFYFLLAHGLLHLVGYDDKTEKGRLAMVELGTNFMNRLFPEKVV